MPAILGWLIAGMFLGPHALGLLTQSALDAGWYRMTITWMQCAFGLMLGTELIWKKIRSYGRALMVTTLTQSLGTFAVVSAVFAVVFALEGIPLYLALAFGGIALATAPAPALSIVQEFHTKGPVTDTLLPMAVLDDVVGIVVFFSVNSYIASRVSGGAVPLYMIPEEKLSVVTEYFHPVLAVSLLAAIVDLGAPLGFHLILGAGLYTFIYIGARAAGKYCGARAGATLMKMPDTVRKYLGLTLLPHSGVSLVFTGIVCGVLQSTRPDLASVVKGTIAAAAVINEIIAVFAAKRGFELAGEINGASNY